MKPPPKAQLINKLTVYILRYTSEVNGLNTTDLLLSNASDGRAGLLSSGSDEVGGSDERATLSGRGGHLTGQLATKSLGEASRSHCEDIKRITEWRLKKGRKGRRRKFKTV